MLIAGMDTTTNTLAHILNLLSQHQDVQDRLRTEILQAIEADGDGAALDFDRLMTSRTSKPCAESPSDCMYVCDICDPDPNIAVLQVP